MKDEKLIVSRYRVPAPVSAVIAVAADLHGAPGAECLRKLKEIRPDLIVCPGDMGKSELKKNDVDRSLFAYAVHSILKWVNHILHRGKKTDYRVDTENAFRFFEQASAIAPVYYSLGNHDWEHSPEQRARLSSVGVHLLDCTEEHVDLPGGSLWIGGLENAKQIEFVSKFLQNSGYRVLLCHRPEMYEPYLKDTDLDLIICGHAHGGQWRFFGRAVYAPGQGFLPKYTRGVYDGRLAVSAGLVNTTSVPRFGNPPEVMVLELGKE